MLKLENNTHKEHQPIPQTSSEYSDGPSGENIKTTGKQEAIHSSTNATNRHKSNCEQGKKGLKLVSYQVFASISQDLGEVGEIVHMGTI